MLDFNQQTIVVANRTLCKIIRFMKTILLLTDFSEKSQNAAEYAWQLASNLNANLIFFNAYYVPQGTIFAGIYTSYYSDFTGFKKESMKKLKFQAEKVKEKFGHSKTKHVPTIKCENEIGDLGDSIQKILDKKDIWMVVMGDKRTDGFFNHLLYTSDTKEVVAKANCPVMLIPVHANFTGFKKLVFTSAAFDQNDLKTLDFLTELANPFKSEIIVTHVSPKHEKGKETENVLKEVYSSWSAMKYKKLSFHDIKSEDVTESIMKYAHVEDIDLITLIHKKYPFFEDLFHTSTTKKMLDYHKIPLLVFPPNFRLEKEVKKQKATPKKLQYEKS